jgi:hypothetical protein
MKAFFKTWLGDLFAFAGAWLESKAVFYANGGPLTMRNFMRTRTTLPGQKVGLAWTLYDYQIYPAAGVNQLNFFQQPKGQGITSAPGAVVGTAKTEQDTNMEIGGQLPRFMDFLVEVIVVQFWPGSSNVANTFAPRNPSFAHAAPVVVGDFSMGADVTTFRNSGVLDLQATSVSLLTEGPMDHFPSPWNYSVQAAVAANGANDAGVIEAQCYGSAYVVAPSITLLANQNFNVQTRWPGLVPLPSGFNGRMGVSLIGQLARNAS